MGPLKSQRFTISLKLLCKSEVCGEFIPKLLSMGEIWNLIKWNKMLEFGVCPVMVIWLDKPWLQLGFGWDGSIMADWCTLLVNVLSKYDTYKHSLKSGSYERPHWRNLKRRFDIFEMQKGGHTCSIHNTFRRMITANKKPVKWKACHYHSKGNEWAYWICGDWSDDQVNWGQQHANGYEYKYLREKTEIIEVVLPKSKTFKDCCVCVIPPRNQC